MQEKYVYILLYRCISHDLFEIANCFNKLGVKEVLITLGSRGSAYLIDGKICYQKAQKVTPLLPKDMYA